MTKEKRRRVHSVTCSCTIELYDNKRSCLIFADFFPYRDFSRGFSQYIINFAGRNSEVAMGGGGGGH
jgi:hypothetical protein